MIQKKKGDRRSKDKKREKNEESGKESDEEYSAKIFLTGSEAYFEACRLIPMQLVKTANKRAAGNDAQDGERNDQDDQDKYPNDYPFGMLRYIFKKTLRNRMIFFRIVLKIV